MSDVLAQGRVPLVLGGDHSITYWAVKAVFAHIGPLTLLHFDAHHDAYPSHLLNHYTFVHHVKRRFDVAVRSVGCRHDGSAPIRLDSDIDGPTYITLDVDFFSPELVPEVVHPVQGPGPRPSLTDLEMSLRRVRGPVVGADIVEWISDDATPESTGVVTSALSLIREAIGS